MVGGREVGWIDNKHWMGERKQEDMEQGLLAWCIYSKHWMGERKQEDMEQA